MKKNKFVKFSKFDLIDVLNKYISDKVTKRYIEDWANTIEGNDSIEYNSKDNDLLNEFIYELANPILEGEINKIRAKEMLGAIKKKC